MRHGLTIVLTLALGAAAVARADVQGARRHFDEGRRAYSAGDYARAAREFEAAIRESPLPDLYYNLGTTYDKLGRSVKAATAYRRYLQGRPDAEDRAQIEEMIRRDLEQTGHLDLRIDVPEARVSVDGDPVGTAPLVGIVDLEAGSHQLKIEKPGALPRVMSIAVAAGQTVRIDLAADATLAPAPLAASTTAAGARAAEKTPPRRHSKLRAPAWALVAVAGASLAVGIGLGVAAHQQANTLTNAAMMSPPPLFGAYADTESTGRTYAATGYAFDAIAAAAAVADAVLWVFARREESRLDGR